MITIALAIYLRNYWALAVGSIAGFALLIIASYILHEYRPRICFTKIREVWGFSGWIILEKLAVFFSLRIDYLFIPRIADTAEIGHYHVGAELARMPTIELFQFLTVQFFLPTPSYGMTGQGWQMRLSMFLRCRHCLPSSQYWFCASSR